MSDMQATPDPEQNVQKLFQDAQARPGRRGLTSNTTEILVQNLTPTALAGTQGISGDALESDKALLFVPLLDMTGSMHSFRQEVITAYNSMLHVLQGSSQAEQMLISAWTFNVQSYLLHGYTPTEFVPELTRKNYRPDDTTALYDAILSALPGVVAYGQELRNQGVRTKITMVVFTDGSDNASRNSAAQVRQVVEDLLAQEMYTFVLVGFGSGIAHQTAKQIGFTNVLDANASATDIQQTLSIVSHSLIKTSQSMITNTAANAFFS